MTEQSPAEQKLASLIVETLNLEDIAPTDIEPEEPLFGDALGLDSIDALELAVAISQMHGVELKAEDESSREAFASLRALSGFIEEQRSGQTG